MPDSAPLVTIMIPTYAQADDLMEAVDSALAQTYPHLEVVVSDDASPDDTAARMQQRKDPRLRYHRQSRNLGRVANYRYLLYELARGEWVLNLDGDDVLTDPEFVRTAIDFARTESDLVIIAARQEEPAGIRKLPLPTQPVTLSGRDLLLQMHNRAFAFAHLATLYKRKPALECDFYRMNVLSSDWESLYRLALRGHVAFLPRVVGRWRVTPANASRSTVWRIRFENLRIWPSILDEAVASGHLDRKTADQQLKALYCRSSAIDLDDLLRAGQRLDAFRYGAALYRLAPAVAGQVACSAKRWARLLVPHKPR